MITQLPLTHQFKDLHIKLIELSGLTGLSLKSINSIADKVSLDYELIKPFKINTSINIQQLFYNILIRDTKICKEIAFECLFTDEYINKLALTIITIWELILDTIIKSIKYDKIILFYAFSIDFVDQLHQTTKHNIPNEISSEIPNGKLQSMEHFAVKAFSSDTVANKKKKEDLQDIKKNINKNKVIEGMTKLLSNTVTNVKNNNRADLSNLIEVSNNMSFKNFSAGGNIIISKIKQSINIQDETNMEVTQNITNKIKNDITKDLIENIKMTTTELNSDINKSSDTGKGGTSFGDVANAVAGVVGKGIDALADVFSVGIAAETSNVTEDETTKKLQNEFNLNENFTYKKNGEIADIIDNILNTNNIAACLQKARSENELDFDNLRTTGSIIISELDQVMVVDKVMECAFNQTVINDIAAKMVARFDLLIDQLALNINNDLDEESKARVDGDIYAAGVAGSAILESVGNAGSKVLKESAVVVEKAGEAANDALTGVAKFPLAIGLAVGFVFLSIAIAAFFIWRKNSPEKVDGGTHSQGYKMKDMNGANKLPVENTPAGAGFPNGAVIEGELNSVTSDVGDNGDILEGANQDTSSVQ
jgi:hypothetical protein